MLIATFGPSANLAGKKITEENGQLVLEGQGRVLVTHIKVYHSGGHLVWVDEATRTRVLNMTDPAVTTKPLAQKPTVTTKPPAQKPKVTAKLERSTSGLPDMTAFVDALTASVREHGVGLTVEALRALGDSESAIMPGYTRTACHNCGKFVVPAMLYGVCPFCNAPLVKAALWAATASPDTSPLTFPGHSETLAPCGRSGDFASPARRQPGLVKVIGVLLIFGGLIYAIPTAYQGYWWIALPGFMAAVGGAFVLRRGNRDARRVTAERERLGIPSGGGVNGLVLVAVIVVIGLFVLILTGATTVALILIIVIVILAIGGALARALWSSS